MTDITQALGSIAAAVDELDRGIDPQFLNDLIDTLKDRRTSKMSQDEIVETHVAYIGEEEREFRVTVRSSNAKLDAREMLARSFVERLGWNASPDENFGALIYALAFCFGDFDGSQIEFFEKATRREVLLTYPDDYTNEDGSPKNWKERDDTLKEKLEQ